MLCVSMLFGRQTNSACATAGYRAISDDLSLLVVVSTLSACVITSRSIQRSIASEAEDRVSGSRSDSISTHGSRKSAIHLASVKYLASRPMRWMECGGPDVSTQSIFWVRIRRIAAKAP